MIVDLRRILMRLLVLAALIIVVVLNTSCGSSTPAPAPAAVAAPEYRTTATVKELMGSVVSPNAEFVWKSVQSDGSKDKAPKNDEEWAELRRRAVTLRESTDLLQLPGRKMASAGDKAKDSSELAPEAMQALLDKDRAKWIQFSKGLHDSVTEVIKAIDAKNPSAVLDTGGAIDAACENCHQVFWYPDQKK
jgi:cytochrome c556